MSWSQKNLASERRARSTRSLPATICLPPSLRDHVGDDDESVGKLAGLGIAQGEIFLVRAHRGLKNFLRHVHEGGVDLADQHDGPFGEAHHFVGEAFVVDQLEPESERFLLGLVQDGLAAFRGVDDHVGCAQLCLVVIEAANLDRAVARGSDGRG